MTHYITKCKECDAVIAQCRCMGPHEIRYDLCKKCKPMDKLSAEQIDQELKNRDDRKPLRKLVDDHVIPAGGLALGGAVAAASAISNLKETDRRHTIN